MNKTINPDTCCVECKRYAAGGINFPIWCSDNNCSCHKENPKPLNDTKDCRHVWDSEEFNPTCHQCKKLMRDDTKDEPKGWEIEFDERFITKKYSRFGENKYYDSISTKKGIPAEIKQLFRETLQKEREEAYRKGREDEDLRRFGLFTVDGVE